MASVWSDVAREAGKRKEIIQIVDIILMDFQDLFARQFDPELITVERYYPDRVTDFWL